MLFLNLNSSIHTLLLLDPPDGALNGVADSFGSFHVLDEIGQTTTSVDLLHQNHVCSDYVSIFDDRSDNAAIGVHVSKDQFVFVFLRVDFWVI